MAYPYAGVLAVAEGTITVDASTWSPSLTGLTLAKGDLIIIGLDGRNPNATNPAWTPPSGWTERVAGDGFGCFYHYWTGAGDDTTPDFVKSGPAGQGAWQAIQIPVADGPVIAGQAGNNSATLDPAAVTPAAGSAPYLWLAVAGGYMYNGTTAPTAAPTGYSGFDVSTRVWTMLSVTNAASVCHAWKQSTATTEDPGVFTVGALTTGGTATFAIALTGRHSAGLRSTGIPFVALRTTAGLITKDATTAIPGVTNGVSVVILRVAVDIDNGAAGADFRFYASVDGAAEAQIGTTVTHGSALTLETTGTTVPQVGKDHVANNLKVFDGRIYYAQVRDAAVLEAQLPSEFPPGADSLKASTGETWTLYEKAYADFQIG